MGGLKTLPYSSRYPHVILRSTAVAIPRLNGNSGAAALAPLVGELSREQRD